MNRILPGINIQWPWSEMIASGDKVIETRTYPLPEKFVGQELAVIETPGPRGKKEAGIEKSRIIGVVVFSQSFEYLTKSDWMHDFSKHLVAPDDSQYGFDPNKRKFGWVVQSYVHLKNHVPPPPKRGIVYAKDCHI